MRCCAVNASATARMNGSLKSGVRNTRLPSLRALSIPASTRRFAGDCGDRGAEGRGNACGGAGPYVLTGVDRPSASPQSSDKQAVVHQTEMNSVHNRRLWVDDRLVEP